MEHTFWLQRWEQNQIGFHQQEINHYLETHWQELGLPEGAPVFVPLCGKSLDMLWLREQGHPVFGVELSEKAVGDFFDENGIEPNINETDRFSEYCADRLCIFSGDFFQLRQADLGEIHAVYERASLVALPQQMRRRYVAHMEQLLRPGSHILLITMEYPEGVLEGPPFSVSEAEVEALYAGGFTVERKAVWDGDGPRGLVVTEKVYALTRR